MQRYNMRIREDRQCELRCYSESNQRHEWIFVNQWSEFQRQGLTTLIDLASVTTFLLLIDLVFTFVMISLYYPNKDVFRFRELLSTNRNLSQYPLPYSPEQGW